MTNLFFCKIEQYFASKSSTFLSAILLQSFNKMSTATFTNVSPFVAALPASHTFFAYDADGNAIMTDAITGLPITYGSVGSKRSRSASMDSDSADSRPSKRSRMSSDDDENDGGAASSTTSSSLSIKTPKADVGLPSACPPAPRAAKKYVAPSWDDENDGEGDNSVTRNLATSMAEAVLAGEPRWPDNNVIGPWMVNPEPPSVSFSNAAPTTVSSNAAPVGDGPVETGNQDEYYVAVTCKDLALRLEMTHPRVVLNLLRFVSSYNELAPEDEEIHFPYIETDMRDTILHHSWVTNPTSETAAEVAELKALIDRFSCQCPDCEPDNWSDSDRDDRDYDSE